MAGGACAVGSWAAIDVGAAARYVLGRRTTKAGYSFYRTPEWGVEEPSAPDTLAALESLRILAVEVPEPDATVDWLRSLQADDGGFPTLTIAWSALRSLVLLGADPARPATGFLARASRAVVARRAAVDWRAPLRDAARIMELVELGFARSAGAAQSCAALLDAARDRAGGWAAPSADIATTATALRLAAVAGVDVARSSGSDLLLARCEDPVLGVRVTPGSAATSVEAVRAGLEVARALHSAPRYPDAVARSLSLMQRPDGGFGSRHRAISTLADTWDGLRAAQLLDEVQEER
ncbi:MAG TPA: prenyltransferase/squalene oxidase repeat-containing protein [Acidimicrobiales bacterium]|nr:prenyltransferase/squalene oxidase repeat-containing protein [Acidimicrobiales bacterium]